MSTFFEQSVPVVQHTLANLKHVIGKGAAHAAEHELDETALTGFRLFPDMLPLSSQVKIATDMATGLTWRLTGNDRLALDDNAASFQELDARMDTTLAHLKAQDPAAYADSATRPVIVKTPMGDLEFIGASYLSQFCLPNIYFHSVTAYNILRHNGVHLGKMDFMRGGMAP